MMKHFATYAYEFLYVFYLCTRMRSLIVWCSTLHNEIFRSEKNCSLAPNAACLICVKGPRIEFTDWLSYS